MPRDATMTRGKASVGHTRRCTYGSPIPTLRDGHLHGTAAVPYDHGTAAGAYQAAGEDVRTRPRSVLPLEVYPWAGGGRHGAQRGPAGKPGPACDAPCGEGASPVPAIPRVR